MLYLRMTSQNALHVMSYNCPGINIVKTDYINSLLSICDKLFIQQHWLCHAQIQSLLSLNLDFVSCGVCGFDSQTVLQERPYGGCAILWCKQEHADVRVINTGSRHVCAIRCISDCYKQFHMAPHEFSVATTRLNTLINEILGESKRIIPLPRSFLVYTRSRDDWSHLNRASCSEFITLLLDHIHSLN